MTVAELIEKLQKMPQDAQVVRGDASAFPIALVEWANEEWAAIFRGKVAIS